MNQLDLIAGFAALALKNNYVKPALSNKHLLDIKRGRHPVVEQLLPATEKFIPNDLSMNSQTNQIHLLTGPNVCRL